MPRLYLPSFLSFGWASSFAGAQEGRAEEECRLLGRLTPIGSTGAADELIALFIDFETSCLSGKS